MKCIRINQIKLPLTAGEEELRLEILRLLKIKEENLEGFRVVKRSTDARKKPDIRYVYSVNVYVHQIKKIHKKVFQQNISLIEEAHYHFQPSGEEKLTHRPVVAGMGPAGLFCAYYLAKNGYRPIVIERGEPVEQREQTVQKFWEEGILNPESNVQFGEGGAGTFSDGKLNTMVKDKTGRNTRVLEDFITFGAKEEIRYVNKPHIGTDVLKDVVKNMREEIIRLGGEVRFSTKLTGIRAEMVDGKQVLAEITLNDSETLRTEVLVLAVGHSARDTFALLDEMGIAMSAKAFAVGLRMEHKQQMINEAMYGTPAHDILEAADYKVTYQTPEHGIYSFCMCPGGYVVNASSEPGRLAVNGMSYSGRDGENANSAIVITVSPKDYGTGHVLDGVRFQRGLEERAYEEGKGNIPVQCFRDFCENTPTVSFGQIHPATKGAYRMANLRNVLPETLAGDFIQAIHGFSRQIPGFDRGDAVLSGIESRTSSPVRIERNDSFTSLSMDGMYPCGEGAGYAGGITSAAMDGIRVFEAIADRYAPFE